MAQQSSKMAEEIAQAASALQKQRTGHAPKSVAVVLSDDTLVITLHEALSPAEKSLAKSSEGAAQVQEFHRHLFLSASDTLRQQIKRITGMEVLEGSGEVDPKCGPVLHIFPSGTMVQMFLLSGNCRPDTSMPEAKHENRGPRPRKLPELIYKAPMIFFVWATRPNFLPNLFLKGDRNANGISV